MSAEEWLTLFRTLTLIVVLCCAMTLAVGVTVWAFAFGRELLAFLRNVP